MDKKVWIAIVVLVLLFGWWFLWSKNSQNLATKNVPAISNESEPTSGQGQGEQNAGGVTDWLKTIASGKQMSCSYKMNEGAQATEVKVSMEGKKYRSEIISGGTQWIALFDGQTMYSWSLSQKQGMKIDMKCMEQFKTQSPAGASSAQTYEKSPEDILQKQPDIQCVPTSGAADFSVPSDIQFSDQCAMMEQSAEMMKKYKDALPKDIQNQLPVGQ